MNFEEFTYEVHAEVTFSGAELELLRKLGSTHYDHECERFVSQGGTGYGWKNQFRYQNETTPDKAPDKTVQVKARFRDLDITAKILEALNFMPEPDDLKVGSPLLLEIGRVVRQLREETHRLIEEQKELQR